MKILITGAAGFMGRNLAENLKLRQHELLLFDVNDTEATLREYAAQAEFVFHLAGVNRPKEESEFQAGNADFTQALLDLLAQAGAARANGAVPVAMTSSIQAALNNPYGRSKREAEEAMFAYGGRTGAPVYVYRFPNAFGKWSRPNYNSVVATFCYNAARGLPLRIDDPSREMTFVYIDDIVDEFLRALQGAATPSPALPGYYESPVTHSITLGGLAEAVQGFAQSRRDLTHAYDRSDPLLQKLYATWLSYLPEDGFSSAADMKRDARGFFAELIKSPYFGQISVSRTRPGITRGNHWHNTKVEKFIVVEGEALITFRKIDSDEVLEYPVSGEKVEIVDIPPGYTHAITNTGTTDLLTIFWAGELFDPEHPDTYFLEV